MSMLSTTTVRHFRRIVVLLLALVLQGAAYAQTTLRVDGDNGSPTGDGSGWGGDAYRFLPDAIAFAAANADEFNPFQLWVAATGPENTYRPNRDAANPGGIFDLESTFLLDFDNVQLLGGFNGTETDPDDRDPAVHITVLSG